MPILKRHPKQTEYQYVHMMFKLLKSRIKTWEDATIEEIHLLQRYYPWLFTYEEESQ